MKNEIMKQNQSEITITKDDIKKLLCPNATDKELLLALNIIKSYGLNPFKKEVHIIKYGNSPASIIVGYEVYLKRAERTGKLDGWRVWIEKDDIGEKAVVEIKRKDWSQPFRWEVYRHEVDKKQSTWKQMPIFMLKKVAIAQAFRICFPDELGGLPYTKEEHDIIEQSQPQNNKIIDIKTEEVKVEEAKEEPQTHNYKFLQEMQKIKKEVGEDVYYEVLNAYGFKKSSEITDGKTQVKVYTELKRLAEDLKEAENIEVEIEEKQEPTPEQQRVAEKLKELFGGEEIKE